MSLRVTNGPTTLFIHTKAPQQGAKIIKVTENNDIAQKTTFNYRNIYLFLLVDPWN